MEPGRVVFPQKGTLAALIVPCWEPLLYLGQRVSQALEAY